MPARSHPLSASRLPSTRFRFALAVSALAHAWLLTSPPQDLPWRGWAFHPPTAAMTVRLEAPPVSAPDGTVVSAPGVHEVPLAEPRSAARAEQSSRRDPPIVEARPVREASALPVAPDPHYYAARDLDSFPWPLAPLPFERLAGARRGEVRLELLIDELGIVREVLFVGRARPDLEDGELHAALTAAQFVPARKDGRAVKSRVWMSIRYDANSQ